MPTLTERPGKPIGAADSYAAAEALVDAGIWPRREPGQGTRYESPEQRRFHAKNYARKRCRKEAGEAYLRQYQNSRRYLASLPAPARRKWEAWEIQFVADHPFHSCREIAAALGRSIKGVTERRMDPDNSKRLARCRKVRAEDK